MLKLIKNATIVNEGRSFVGSVLIRGEFIQEVFEGETLPQLEEPFQTTDATGLLLIPGVIDDQVHFREPGLTHKGNILTESRAAVAGGVTSFMEMPNTQPQATTLSILDQKFEIASKKSAANYSFYMGATNDNLDEVKKIDPKNVCGIKVFMGSSTGNMLVDNEKTLSAIFAEAPTIIATHCEEESIIRANIEHYKQLLDNNIPVQYHPLIRSAEACYRSSAKAAELATKYNSRLHILHLSTEREMSIFDNTKALKDKKITAEVCVHHLWFSDKDYEKFGTRIKWNPAIKTEADREALINALINNKIDVVATDHAPHLLNEKEGNCLTAASGGPLVQHSLVAMLEMAKNGNFTVEEVVNKMCHAPAELFHVVKRGFIRKGYFADLVLVNPSKKWTVTKDNILYKCMWSPFENYTFSSKVITTWVNGKKVYDKDMIDDSIVGRRLEFDY